VELPDRKTQPIAYAALLAPVWLGLGLLLGWLFGHLAYGLEYGLVWRAGTIIVSFAYAVRNRGRTT